MTPAGPQNPNAQSCFVIGPIGDAIAPVGSPGRERYEVALEVYERIIQPACQAVGLVPERADDISRPGEIGEQVFVRLRDRDIVVADVTDANPNVMYELGLRHSTGKPTVQIGEFERLPFDINAIRTIRFTRTPMGLVDGRRNLESALHEVMDVGWDAVAAARLFGQQLAPAGASAPASYTTEAAGDDDEEGPGFLELLADMEQALPAVAGTLNQIGAVIQEIGGLASKGSADMAVDQARGGGAAGRLAIALRFAQELENPAERLESLSGQYEDQLRRVDSGFSYILGRAEAEPAVLAELGAFPETMIRLSESARTGMGSAESLVRSVRGIEGAARPLRVPVRRIAAALNRVVSASLVIQGWGRRAEALMSGGATE